MPRATVSGDLVHKELRTCPGGWVDLKQLTYDQMLHRRDNATKMFMEQTGTPNSKVSLQVANKWAVSHDFRLCIADHNLEDEDGNKLDFSNPLTFQVLDPRVGQEIETYIDELNQDLEADLAVSPSRVSSSSTESLDTRESLDDTEVT